MKLRPTFNSVTRPKTLSCKVHNPKEGCKNTSLISCALSMDPAGVRGEEKNQIFSWTVFPVTRLAVPATRVSALPPPKSQ